MHGFFLMSPIVYKELVKSVVEFLEKITCFIYIYIYACIYDYKILVLSKCSSSITVGRGFLEHCSVDLVASNLKGAGDAVSAV